MIKIRLLRYLISLWWSCLVNSVSNVRSVGQVVDASSAAVHLGVLVTDDIQFDQCNLDIFYLVFLILLNCTIIDSEDSVLNTLLQQYLLFIRVAGILTRVQREVLVRASNYDFQQDCHFLSTR